MLARLVRLNTVQCTVFSRVIIYVLPAAWGEALGAVDQ